MLHIQVTYFSYYQQYLCTVKYWFKFGKIPDEERPSVMYQGAVCGWGGEMCDPREYSLAAHVGLGECGLHTAG